MSKADDHAKHHARSKTKTHTEVHVETDSVQAIAGAMTNDLAELTEDLKRVQAEFVNFKRRAEAERSEVMSFATSRIVRQFLTVRDSFEAEAEHRPEDTNPVWAASIDSIRAQFDKVMKDLGVEKFVSVGEDFDPHQHEAVAHEGDGNVVTEELAPGYKLGDTILRPAMVKVGGSKR